VKEFFKVWGGLIVSAALGLLIWRLQQRILKHDRESKERDDARAQSEFLCLRGNKANYSLGKQCALSIQRGQHNGQLQAALEFAEQVSHEQEDFITQEGVKRHG
jgi:hypothetical protein